MLTLSVISVFPSVHVISATDQEIFEHYSLQEIKKKVKEFE